MLTLFRSQPRGRTLLKFDTTGADKTAKVQVSTLYVCRPLLNISEVHDWMKSSGFKTGLDEGDMHVTICYSKALVAWEHTTLGDFTLIVPCALPGQRQVSQFGKATVLQFYSAELQDRWRHFRDLGASWDFPNYNPHITLTWETPGFDLAAVEPYVGELVFAPEEFSPIQDGWHDRIDEVRIKSEVIFGE